MNIACGQPLTRMRLHGEHGKIKMIVLLMKMMEVTMIHFAALFGKLTKVSSSLDGLNQSLLPSLTPLRLPDGVHSSLSFISLRCRRA